MTVFDEDFFFAETVAEGLGSFTGALITAARSGCDSVPLGGAVTVANGFELASIFGVVKNSGTDAASTAPVLPKLACS